MSAQQQLKNLYKNWDTYTAKYGDGQDEIRIKQRDQLINEIRENEQ